MEICPCIQYSDLLKTGVEKERKMLRKYLSPSMYNINEMVDAVLNYISDKDIKMCLVRTCKFFNKKYTCKKYYITTSKIKTQEIKYKGKFTMKIICPLSRWLKPNTFMVNSVDNLFFEDKVYKFFESN